MSVLWRIQQLLPIPVSEEQRLIQAARQGRQEAFDALMRPHEGALHGFLVRRVGPSAADDVLQETRMACWQALPRYGERSRFKTWLFGIACHKSADYLRTKKNGTGEVSLEQVAPDRPDSGDAYAQVELKMMVTALLDSLPSVQKEVMELYYYGELTLPEIAQLLGRNLNTVKAQFYRAHVRAVEEWQAKMPSVEPSPGALPPKGVSLP